MRKNPKKKTTKAFQCNVNLVLNVLFQLNNLERKNVVVKPLGSRTFSRFTVQKKDSAFCMFCMKHKGKLTAEHNMEEAYITRGLIIGRNLLKHLLITNNLNHIELHWIKAITHESVVPQCGDVLEMTVN